MKRHLLIFFRVIFVLLLMVCGTIFGLRTYYLHQSAQGIEKSLDVSTGAIYGNEKAPFTIVEFFDYRCPHCSTLNKILIEAVGDDLNKDTRILLRPTVVVDDQSFKIAKFVLALDNQQKGKTVAVHKEIMALSEVPTYEAVKAMAGAHGLNVEQAEKDSENFKKMISDNTAMAEEVGFTSVPALIIGDKGYFPMVAMPGVNEMRLMIIDAKTRLKIPTI